MYSLLAFCPASREAIERVSTAATGDVRLTIANLFAKHPSCERVEVELHGMKLFTMDCQGNASPP